jgi:hypothetical protein
MRASLRSVSRFSIQSASIALVSVGLPLSCESLPFITKQAGTPGKVKDEARSANRAAASFPAADEDYFADMDGGAKLSAEEVKQVAAVPDISARQKLRSLPSTRKR